MDTIHAVRVNIISFSFFLVHVQLWINKTHYKDNMYQYNIRIIVVKIFEDQWHVNEKKVSD